MASEGKFRHEEVAAVPEGYKVRTVTHPSGHEVRIAFPPGPRRAGSGQLVSVLHPLTGSNPCPNLGPETPCEFKFSNPTESIKDSKGRTWFVTTLSSGKDWMAEGYLVEGKRLKRVGQLLIARGSTEAEAGDKLAEMIDAKNPVEKSKVESQKSKRKNPRGKIVAQEELPIGTKTSQAFQRGEKVFPRANPKAEENLAAEGWKSVSGEKIDRSQFAYVGDPELNETWKLPIHDAAHVRNAMARFGRTRLPRDARRAVAERIAGEAKKYGIDSARFEEKWLRQRNPLDEAAVGRIVAAAKRRGIINPDGSETEQATELYKKFHGKDPRRIIEQQEADTIRGTYVALGDRPVLVFDSPGGDEIQLDFNGDGTKLAANAEGTQLYLIGGDQELPDEGLDQFGSDASKDFVDLGEALTVTYDARKRHNNFQLASWKHEFGEEGGARPWGFYDKLRKRIFLVGGSYKVEAPGIEN